jgi:hypothetical protein
MRWEWLVLAMLAGCELRAQAVREPKLPVEQMAQTNFGADAPWFERNIPFLEIDDPEIQQIYYYRWKLFRGHIREIGAQGTTVLEFLPNVPWARQPYTDLNDSAAFHLREGRWLRDSSVVDNLIDHLYTGGANDRHFSEWIVAATVDTTLVTGDPAPALKHLDTMQHIYNLWDDHLDPQRALYWIEPLLDATEYTIASIDASGAGFVENASKDQNQNGFTGGFAYRPSINSYQYGNALAIARLARLAGMPEVAADYEARAAKLQAAVLSQLWNPQLEHFTDRYQRSTAYGKAGAFIRGRELVGFVPWMFELPPAGAASSAYGKAWQHALSPSELGGPFGLRTVEPSYARYMVQYRYDAATGLRECQWNGPSWPFQTSEALTAMANLLDDYPASGVTANEYLRLLRQYTQEHFLSPGHPDLQEDYDPDTGKPIVGLPRSHHYSHSTYVDLVLSGLIGVRPRADNLLELRPLVPVGGDHPIRYFALQRLAYHGHQVSVIYDAEGTRYGIGRGLSVFVDGKLAAGAKPLGPLMIRLTPVRLAPAPKPRVDLAVNVGVPDGPRATASSSESQQGLAEAIDGRMWFFPEIANGWSPAVADSSEKSWYEVDFGAKRTLGEVELSFLDEGESFAAPASYRVQVKAAEDWKDVRVRQQAPAQAIAGGVNTVKFAGVSTPGVRVVFTRPKDGARFRLIELKAFAPLEPSQ